MRPENKTIVWGLTFFTMALFLFLTGFHNIDTAYNMDPNQFDIGVFYNIRSRDKLYLDGCLGLIISIIGFAIANILFISNTR